jgi:hypothetical protein
LQRGAQRGRANVPSVDGGPLTGHVPASIKRRIPTVRERDALRREVQELRARVRELEGRLDHERLFPAQWANRRVRDQFGNEVQAGPFAGMRYPDWGLTDIDLFAPKLLGIFECELHPALERLISSSPDVVVNVGAAEGYYAIGLALRLPEARVIAFDLNEQRLEQLAGIAELNGVRDRVEIVSAACGHEGLDRCLSGRSAVVCDCDGCEADLLDPARVPALRTVPLLVEVHDLLVEGTTKALREAFASSHDIAQIDTRARFVDDYPELDFMPLVTRQLAISEFRGAPMWWLELTPRAV